MFQSKKKNWKIITIYIFFPLQELSLDTELRKQDELANLLHSWLKTRTEVNKQDR